MTTDQSQQPGTRAPQTLQTGAPPKDATASPAQGAMQAQQGAQQDAQQDAQQGAQQPDDFDGLEGKKPEELTPEELRLMADTMPGEGPGD